MRDIPISVSRKILADVSSGIYRTPANALKELVSNAFDASANKVYISTNIPYFNVFTCEDDGKGMTVEEFEKVLKVIGSSKKRTKDFISEAKRPVIGKIGIGLLAVAQICNKFTVISKKKNSKCYFQATIDLKQFDEIEQEENAQDDEGITLGKCQIEEGLIDEVDPRRQYTKIIMEEIKEGFKEKLLEKENKIKFGIKEMAHKSEAIIDLINSIKSEKSFNELSQYDQLIWELCLICPVEYVENGPLPKNDVIKEEIKGLRDYKFKVFVDGFELRKPILFPTDDSLKKWEIDYKIYPRISLNKKVGNSKLEFTGYLIHQRTRILPSELRGILIRIKGVAIGSYDKTFLHYPKAEGPMINQLSGEIFVDEGLEESLNIDRNSFNEAHPHYLKLQEFLWNFLGGEGGVFKDIRKRSKERRDIFHEEKSKEELLGLLVSIKSIFGLKVEIKRRNKKGKEAYLYDRNKKVLTFYSHPFWTKHKNKRLKQEKLVLTVVAAKNVSDTIDSFEKNLLKLFSKGR